MDFFGAQEQARSQTRRLIFLFVLAVVAIIVSIYLVVMVTLSGSAHTQTASLWNPHYFFSVAAITLLVISGGSLYKTSALASGGGESVAESLGGRRVSRSTTDPLEKRLLNVVDEMAIASGIPTPKVFILDDEPGINAFAAGFTTHEAVIAVTRGCLEQLSRDELQGVVAHEFSHILNGDMRLNLRLIGVLYGILLLALMGRIVLNSSSGSRRSKNGGGIVIIGVGLLVVGYIGVFFGNIIKAAASRQREFLADASAVQFTRNPDGIAGALKKIGGFEASVIRHPRAEEASHMFFGEGLTSSFSNLFATHPPIEERIRRIDRTFEAERKLQRATTTAASPLAAGFAGGESITVAPEQVVASVGTVAPHHVAYAQQLIDSLPASIRADIDQPNQARALVYALLVVGEEEPPQVLQQALQDEPADLVARAEAHVATLKQVGRASWLPILDLLLPVLDEEDGDSVSRLLANTKRLIEADGRVTLFEYLVDSLLSTTLSGKPGQKGNIHRYSQKNVHDDCATVLALLAHLGHRNAAAAQAAFAAAARRAPSEGEWILAERSSITLARFDQALNRLATLNHRFRAQLIEACSAAIAHDGEVAVMEAELLRIIGAKLDCPIPPLLATA